MKDSKEYTLFFEVEGKYKIDDIVDWCRHNRFGVIIPRTCVITDIGILADFEDNFEESYKLFELIDGVVVDK